jgi:hypothetical protein
MYSWGVLHHTGEMWQVLDNVINCVECAGKLRIALYNEHKNSARWLKIKGICNRWHRTVFPLVKATYIVFIYVRLLSCLHSPTKYVRQYPEDRGMTFWRDVEDWLYGLPYESDVSASWLPQVFRRPPDGGPMKVRVTPGLLS